MRESVWSLRLEFVDAVFQHSRDCVAEGRRPLVRDVRRFCVRSNVQFPLLNGFFGVLWFFF